MKELRNTLEVEIDRWDDPGDYPSGAGGGPLPGYNFISGVDGQVVVELEPDDLAEYKATEEPDVEAAVADWVGENPTEIDTGLPGVVVTAWHVDKVEGTRATLSVESFNADAYDVQREPDYDDMVDRFDDNF